MEFLSSWRLHSSEGDGQATKYICSVSDPVLSREMKHEGVEVKGAILNMVAHEELPGKVTSEGLKQQG